jgi:hypothetical protein
LIKTGINLPDGDPFTPLFKRVPGEWAMMGEVVRWLENATVGAGGDVLSCLNEYRAKIDCPWTGPAGPTVADIKQLADQGSMMCSFIMG